LRAEEVAFIGDDVIDLPVFAKCGLSAAPCDAHPSVLKAAQLKMKSGGGRGAVRELCDLILQYGALKPAKRAKP
jgi:3-deoxy-D-manno-octulosonate 8-phosphate phosphatase (KDO 8-P phosphatase)